MVTHIGIAKYRNRFYQDSRLQPMKMDVSQTASFIQAMSYEAGLLEYDDFPQTTDPVWILGCAYDARTELQQIKKDISSRIWLTYRKGFPAIGGSGPTSDTGWGCMLRCGQMMLAQALAILHLGRDWRWSPGKYEPKYLQILLMFLDRKTSFYSIHQIAMAGVSEGKKIGQWFGPNTIAQVLRKLAPHDNWSNIAVHVALDNTLIKDDIEKLASSSRVEWRPILIIIPLRLGLSEINSIYISSLKTVFEFPQCVGVLGGKPNHALWFIGVIDNEFLYLDPHTTQSFTTMMVPGDKDESFHCQYTCRMKIHNMDPSLAVGFFCKTRPDFEALCNKITLIEQAKTQAMLFEIHQSRPSHWPQFELPAGAEAASRRHYDDSDEEFELL